MNYDSQLSNPSRSCKLNSFAFFFLFVALFFPTKGFYTYHVVLCSILVPLILLQGSIGTTAKVKILSAILAYMITINIVTAVWFKVDAIRNIVDAGRVIPVLLFWLYAKSYKVNFKVIFNVTAMFSVANIVVILMQLFGVSAASLLSGLYASSLHAANIIWRPSGLNTGPGQNATISIALFAIFSTSVLMRYRVLVASLCALFSALAIVMSQSRSGFVALAVVGLYLGVLVVSRWVIKGRRPNLVAISCFGAACSGLVYFLWDKLTYLSTVLTVGIGLHSYQAREDKWSDIFNMIVADPLFFIIGHGKDFIGSASGAVDNEYLFFLTVYGALSVVMITGFVCAILIRPFWAKRNLGNPKIILFGSTIAGGAVIAWATSFLLDPRVLILLGMICVTCFEGLDESKKQSAQGRG